MTSQNDGQNDAAGRVEDSTTLRRRAEERARATGDQDLEALSPEEARRLVHELRVRQIELEMQNEELRTQQQRLDLMLDNMPAYIAYLDSDLNILHANRAMAEWWGYSKEQVVGRNFKEVAVPGGYERNAPYLRQALASRQTVTYERLQVNPRGQTVFARPNFVPHVDEQGNVQGLVALILDVTEQKRADEALRASEERYRLLVENMREGLAMVDENGMLAYVNDSLCAMTGWAREELLGQASVKLFAAEDQERHLDRLARRRAGFSDTYEAGFQCQDGGKVPVLISASPILDAQGHYRGSLAVCTDFTERVEAEEALRQRVEELTVLNRIAHTMATAVELPTTLAQASEIIAGLFPAHWVHIIWPEGEEAGVYLHVGCEPGSGQAGPSRFHFTQDELAVVGRVLREARSQVVEDVQSLPLSDLERELLVHGPVRSILFIPLLIRGAAVGLLWIASDRPGHSFTANEMRLAETIALDLAAAIESAGSSRQAQAAAAAEERGRLARDLHDAATQTIYAATLIVEALPETWARNPAEGQRNLVKLRHLVRGALAEMRTLLFELRPWTLEAVELSRLLEYLGNALTGRTRVPVQWDIRGEHELSAETNVALYRIAQEAFNNIAKHASPTRVRVTLRREAKGGRLSIEDDGHGFDPASVGGDKMGLQIMRERAQAIGATLTIDSAPGRGATVTVAWKKDEGPRTKDGE
jgi:two-component system nitrate/nitrite sensor histidine kinase NarX